MGPHRKERAANPQRGAPRAPAENTLTPGRYLSCVASPAGARAHRDARKPTRPLDFHPKYLIQYVLHRAPEEAREEISPRRGSHPLRWEFGEVRLRDTGREPPSREHSAFS